MKELEKQFVEEVGIVFDNTGLPRMAGRIFGWLLISDPPYQSPAEIAEALMTSRGSISTMTRFLIQMGVIERIGKPGDRNDYFRVKQEQWKEFLGHGFIDEMKMFRQMAEHGLALMAGRDHPNRKLLETMHAVHSFLEREFPALVERWEREYQAKSE
jgi:DNA-binding transcriptional regulator GbsR (MarR family)